MRRHVLIFAIIWLVVTVLGELFVSSWNIYPPAAALEAEHIDRAVRTLLMLAVPVFTFVSVALLYSVVRFRARDDEEEGPPVYGNTPFAVGWLVVTGILAGILFYNPGFTGWMFLKSNPHADMVVKVTAAQWHWHITYPDYDLTIKSAPVGYARMDQNTPLALPVGRRVKFEVTSVDVIHSFWIPALRLKIDAVPGKVTTMYATLTEEGSFEEDANFRVQCAELCGTGHPRMNMPLVIMRPDEFEKWVKMQKQMGEMGGMGEMGSGGHTEGDQHSGGQ